MSKGPVVGLDVAVQRSGLLGCVPCHDKLTWACAGYAPSFSDRVTGLTTAGDEAQRRQ